MKHVLFAFTCVSVLLSSSTTFAQSKKEAKGKETTVATPAIPTVEYSAEYKGIKKDADKLFEYEEFKAALDKYMALEKLQSGNLEVLYKIGVCNMRYIHHENAYPFLRKAYDGGYRTTAKPTITKDEYHDQFVSYDLEFNLARAYHLNYEFEKAIRYYKEVINKYKQVYHNHAHDQELKILDKLINQAQNGKNLMKDTVEVVVENLGNTINSEFEDITPVITADESTIIFTSRRPGSTGGIIDEDSMYHEDIYISKKDNNGKWGTPTSISSNINTAGHDAAIGLSADGQKLFVYKNDNHGAGDIYVSYLEGSNWSAPKKMETVNTKYLENSASISSDRKYLFFTSNRPGGYGGEDIYMSMKLDNDQWSEPINAGPIINTEFDEDAPFIHPDGKTLYFSSKGHTSMGGFDVFKTTYNAERNVFSKPQNLGYPINTPENDIFFVWSPDGKRAYFSSHRNDSYGLDDIYMMTLSTAKISLIVLTGEVTTKGAGAAQEAKISVVDNATGQVVNTVTPNSSTGKYTVVLPTGKNYGLSIEAPNHLPYSENIDIPSTGEYHELQKNFELEGLTSGSIVNLKNVFFDYNKSDLRAESYIELDKYIDLLQKNPSMRVEIAGHTDADGTNKYNSVLSQNRAESVVKYFISKGIDKDRMFSTGYGEEFPVATNTTEEGKQLNRRTEFIVHDTSVEGAAWKKKVGHYYKKENKK